MAELKIISMDEVQSKEVNWLWYPYIPYGKITIIQGDPGEGKTTLALRLAALLSKGEALPYDDTEREPVKIIYQTAEDGLEDTIKPRLEAAEADCTQIKVIDESEAALSMLDERIEKAIIEVGARVVILDPIQAYVGANINMNNANEVRNVMAQLGRIAEKYDCAILLVGPWADPANGLIYVFLSNRVYPTRDNKAFDKMQARVGIHELAYQLIEEGLPEEAVIQDKQPETKAPALFAD